MWLKKKWILAALPYANNPPALSELASDDIVSNWNVPPRADDAPKCCAYILMSPKNSEMRYGVFFSFLPLRHTYLGHCSCKPLRRRRSSAGSCRRSWWCCRRTVVCHAGCRRWTSSPPAGRPLLRRRTTLRWAHRCSTDDGSGYSPVYTSSTRTTATSGRLQNWIMQIRLMEKWDTLSGRCRPAFMCGASLIQSVLDVCYHCAVRANMNTCT